MGKIIKLVPEYSKKEMLDKMEAQYNIEQLKVLVDKYMPKYKRETMKRIKNEQL